MSNRSYSTDLIKTISIIGVVFIHSATLFGKDSYFVVHMANIFRFCVPCFIVLWAYYFEKSYAKFNKEERKLYAKKRFKHLFKVFFIWSFLYFVITAEWETLTFKNILTMYFSGYGWAGQYYFIIIFQLIILFPYLRNLYFIKLARIIIVLSTILIYLIWGYFNNLIPDIVLKISNRFFIYWVPYVFVGISLASNELKKVKLYFALSVIFIALEFYFLENFKMKHDPYLTPAVIVASLLFFVSVFKNEWIEKTSILMKVVHYIGSNTMTIFVVNPLVIKLFMLVIPDNFFQFTRSLDVIISPILSTSIILGSCLLIAEFIKKLNLVGHLN